MRRLENHFESLRLIEGADAARRMMQARTPPRAPISKARFKKVVKSVCKFVDFCFAASCRPSAPRCEGGGGGAGAATPRFHFRP